MLLTQFETILKHTHSLSFVDKVKIVGNEEETEIQAISDDKSVVIFGELKEPITELNGHTVGWGNMRILDTCCKFSGFEEVHIETRMKNQEDVPAEIIFSSSKQHHSVYRMMDKDMALEQIRVPPFKGVPWDVVVPLQESSLEDLKTFAGVLSGEDPLFTPKIEDGTLLFKLGVGSDSKASIPFAEEVEGKLGHEWSFPISEVLAILRLGSNLCKDVKQKGHCDLSFSNQGALKITIDTKDSIFEYILPPRMR